MWKHDRKTAQIIRSAIDSYPAGLSFSSQSGLPVLVNEKMNRLIWQLTGHTLLETEATWEELKIGEIQSGCTKCDPLWLELTEGVNQENLVFQLPDGKIWHFQKLLLLDQQPPTVQITASDVTELYEASGHLYNNNLRLQSFHQRQKALLQNIVKVNEEKELLTAKVRIHDEFGRCLLMTRMALDDPPENYQQITENWLKSIRDLRAIPSVNPTETTVSDQELVRISEMIGCKISFQGSIPRGRTPVLLFYAAVREALTNAVRHGHASQLIVNSKEEEKSFLVEIWDNGQGSSEGAAEGGGLTALRDRMEQDGSSLEVCWTPKVKLILRLQKEGQELL